MSESQSTELETERMRMEGFYIARLSAKGMNVGWGRDKKTGDYLSLYAKDAWAAWQAAGDTERTKRLQAEHERDCAVEKLAEVRADAAETVASWGGYASAYFQEKHNLAADIERMKGAVDVEAEHGA